MSTLVPVFKPCFLNNKKCISSEKRYFTATLRCTRCKKTQCTCLLLAQMRLLSNNMSRNDNNGIIEGLQEFSQLFKPSSSSIDVKNADLTNSKAFANHTRLIFSLKKNLVLTDELQHHYAILIVVVCYAKRLSQFTKEEPQSTLVVLLEKVFAIKLSKEEFSAAKKKFLKETLGDTTHLNFFNCDITFENTISEQNLITDLCMKNTCKEKQVNDEEKDIVVYFASLFYELDTVKNSSNLYERVNYMLKEVIQSQDFLNYEAHYISKGSPNIKIQSDFCCALGDPNQCDTAIALGELVNAKPFSKEFYDLVNRIAYETLDILIEMYISNNDLNPRVPLGISEEKFRITHLIVKRAFAVATKQFLDDVDQKAGFKTVKVCPVCSRNSTRFPRQKLLDATATEFPYINFIFNFFTNHFKHHTRYSACVVSEKTIIGNRILPTDAKATSPVPSSISKTK